MAFSKRLALSGPPSSVASATTATTATTATQVTDQAGGTAKKIWSGNATAYAAVAEKDANTIYCVYADA